MMIQRLPNILSILKKEYNGITLKVVVNIKNNEFKEYAINIIKNDCETLFCSNHYGKIFIENAVYRNKSKPKAIYSVWSINNLHEKNPEIEDIHVQYSKNSNLIITDNENFFKKCLENKCVNEENLIYLENFLKEQ